MQPFRTFTLNPSLIRQTFTCFLFLLITVSAYAGTTELLSDACIADITAGAGDTVITAFYETPTTAYIDNTPRWWGDMDGAAGAGCGNAPGFIVTNLPYNDFQHDNFKYSFNSQAELDAFINDLATLPGSPINVLATDYIKSNPGTDHIFSNDGRPPRVQEIIITTDQKINGDFVRTHNGQVITQNVRFDLEFLPPYARSYTTETTEQTAEGRDGKTGRLLPSRSFRQYNQYEWVQRNNSGVEIIRNADGTFYFTQRQPHTFNFGAIYLECTTTGDQPILSSSGYVVVPPNTTFLRNTIYNDLNVYSPALGMTIGLAPAGETDPETGEISPDLDHYQELGILDIRNLNISLKGGNDIYVYANEDLDVRCP